MRNQLFFNVNLTALDLKTSQIVFFTLFLTTIFTGCSTKYSPNKDTEIVKNKMLAQQQNWNKGNIEKFMEPYWHSDSLIFVGKNGITKGWNKTLNNYKKSYKNKKEMGTLKFTNKVIDNINEQTIFVIGKWELFRDTSLTNLSGHYSLIWKKINNNWVIVSDHSS